MRGILKRIFTFYSIRSFWLAAVLPFFSWFPYFLLIFIFEHHKIISGIGYMALAAIPLLAGRLWAAKAPLPDTLFARLLPLLLPPMMMMTSLSLMVYIPLHMSDEPFISVSSLGIILLAVSVPLCCFYLAFLFCAERRRKSAAKMRGAACLMLCVISCAGLAAAAYYVANRDIVRSSGGAYVGHGVNILLYRPFNPENRLTQPTSPPSLRIASGHPRLDGAIALYPVYAAFAQAVYTGLNERTADEIIKCTNTVEAYQRLTDGQTDIFFGAAPSQEQRDYAAAKGLTLTETPIAREAFVFFVHNDNPVRSLTQTQIRAIYSGRIRNWKDLGGPDEPILAFQRPEGSGSQTTMLRIMEGKAMVRPLREERHIGMGDIILGVAAYRNRYNAIGYSFRWYATALYPNPDIRLLGIDGVEPTPENIKSGAYPFTVPFVAVTARPLSPQSEILLGWILGPEGQDLIRRVGYVPLR